WRPAGGVSVPRRQRGLSARALRTREPAARPGRALLRDTSWARPLRGALRRIGHRRARACGTRRTAGAAGARVRGMARRALPWRTVQLVQLLRFLGGSRHRAPVVRRVTMRTALRAGMTLLLLLATSAVAALTLDELMRDLRSVAERHATFEETKQIALLNGPLVRRGTLDYVAPGRLR